jgi:hypothetical protein
MEVSALPGRSRTSRAPQQTTLWLVNGEKVTVMERVDFVASALMHKPCQLVALPLDPQGTEVVYVNGDQVTHAKPADAAPVAAVS